MSDFSIDAVKRYAQMVRIALTDQEAAELASELQVITSAVEKIQAVVSEDVPATSHPIPLRNVMREDVVGQTLDRDEVLRAAPEAEAGMFKVAQILGEE